MRRINWKPPLFLLLIYLLITAIWTFPLIFNLSTHIFGFPGDPLGSIWSFWWKKQAFLQGIPNNFTNLINYPFGYAEPYLKEFLASTPAEWLAIVTNEIFAYNFFVLFSLPLSGLTMFALIYHLTKNKLASFLSGLAFMLAPYHIWHSYSHFSLAQIQWLPLFVLALIKLDEESSKRNIFFLAVSFTLCFWASFYYGYFMLIFAPAYILVKILVEHYLTKRRYLNLSRVKAWVWAALLVIVLNLPLLFLTLPQRMSPVGQLRSTLYRYEPLPIQLYSAFTARPWDYLLPGIDHPIFGKTIEKIYFNLRQFGEQSGGLNYFFKDAGRAEGTLYLGIVTMGLVVLAWYLYRCRSNTMAQAHKVYVAGFTLIGLLIFILSLPPVLTYGLLQLPLPSYLLYWYFPMFRVLSRLGVMVLICFLIVAAFGMQYLFSGLKTKTDRWVLFIVLAALILLDFLNFPPARLTRVDFVPPVYAWLARQQGDFVIAEYPRAYDENMAKFFQRIHHKKILSWNLVGEDDFIKSDPTETLKENNVRYIIFHQELPFLGVSLTNPGQHLFLKPIPPLLSSQKPVYEDANTSIYLLD